MRWDRCRPDPLRTQDSLERTCSDAGERILRMPMPERVIIVGHFKCEEAAVTLRQLVVVRVLAMGGRVMVVCAQVRSVIVVDMDMIAAGVSVKEDPRARQRHRREEQPQRRGR